jgi:hypothetical protein
LHEQSDKPHHLKMMWLCTFLWITAGASGIMSVDLGKCANDCKNPDVKKNANKS